MHTRQEKITNVEIIQRLDIKKNVMQLIMHGEETQTIWAFLQDG